MTRPTKQEVENALQNVHGGERSQPYPYWSDDEHVLAAEVLAQRASHNEFVETLQNCVRDGNHDRLFFLLDMENDW